METQLIPHLERLSLQAWPALEHREYDGWIVRFAKGYTRRSNSVNPVGEGSLEVSEKIKACEAMYSEQGQRTVFKLTPRVFPHHLDALLAAQGYIQEAVTSVRHRSLAETETPILDAAISPTLDDGWLTLFCRLNNVDARHMPTMRQMLSRSQPQQAFVTLHHRHQPAAVGLGVVVDDSLWFFDIVTESALRNRGLGKQLMLHLMQWGKAYGAANAYLQVMANNAPAVHLYEKLGFREVYPYWYRAKPGA